MAPAATTICRALATIVCAALALGPVTGRAAPPAPPPPPPPPASAPDVAPTPSVLSDDPESASTVPDATPSQPEVESVFDLGLDAPPPPAPDDDEEPVANSAPDPGPAAEPVAVVDRPAAPHRQPPTRLAVTGWSLVLGTFATAAVGSLFVGFAERERTRARRIGVAYDLFTDQPRPLPDDIAEILGESRRDRRTYLNAAAGLGAAAGGLLLTSAIIFTVNAVRNRRSGGTNVRARRRAR